MSKRSCWLYLEPFVFVFSKKCGILFYNSISGKIIEYPYSPVIKHLVDQLNSEKHSYSIKLGNPELKNPTIKKLISLLKKNYMGDLLGESISRNKPFQIMPLLFIQHDVEKLDDMDLEIMKRDAMEYLQEIVFHVTDNCKFECSVCNSAYRQTPFCWKPKNHNADYMPFDFITKTISALCNRSSLKKIYFTGGNLLDYPNLSMLLKTVDSIVPYVSKILYINFYQLENDLNAFVDISQCHQNIKWIVLVDFSILAKHGERLKSVIKELKDKLNEEQFYFHFLVRSNSDLDNESKIVSETELTNYSTFPYYNGRNITFFKRMVFTRKSDIIDTIPSQQDILTRSKIHPIDFGRLTIQNNGDLYGNLNHEKIGNAYWESLNDLIFKEIRKGTSWRAVRSSIEPCKDCAYELLCPPISNYEYKIGRHNLCHLFKVEEEN